MSEMRLGPGSHDFLMVAFFFFENLMRESFVGLSELPFVFGSSSDTFSTVSSIWHTIHGQHDSLAGETSERLT